MRHTPTHPAAEVEPPLAVYIQDAHEQIARTRADGFLNGTRAHDAEIARALAVMNRDADRRDRYYLANKDAVDAARAAADRAFAKSGGAGMMDQRLFTNCVRSLFNIDGNLLPELTREQQFQFIRDPVRYFIGTDKQQQDAIFREVAKRQPREVAA